MEENNEDNITVTYETLFELLRREKDRVELQKLDENFFENVVSYLNEKKAMTNQDLQKELFSEGNTVDNERQLDNVKRIIKELYERREKKIITLALDKSRTKSDIIDTSALLGGEKKLFDALVEIFNNYRGAVLLNVLTGNLPFKLEEAEGSNDSEKTEDNNNTNEQAEVKPAVEINSNDTKMVRFLAAVPKFLGPEGEELGPFEEEDVASLPSGVSELLINKGRVEELKES